MDNDYVLNLDEILRTIETADVVRIRFLLLDKRLLVENRCNEFDGPLVKRVADTGFTDAVHQCDEVFRELQVMERTEIRNAISGEGFQTIWARTTTP